MTQLSVFLLAADAVYLIALGSNAGRAISAFGCLVAVCLLVLPRVSRRFASMSEHDLPDVRRSTHAIVAALFVLPALTRFSEPVVVAFVRLDARMMIVVAWLITTCILIARSRAQRAHEDDQRSGDRSLPVTTVLFI